MELRKRQLVLAFLMIALVVIVGTIGYVLFMPRKLEELVGNSA